MTYNCVLVSAHWRIRWIRERYHFGVVWQILANTWKTCLFTSNCFLVRFHVRVSGISRRNFDVLCMCLRVFLFLAFLGRCKYLSILSVLAAIVGEINFIYIKTDRQSDNKPASCFLFNLLFVWKSFRRPCSSTHEPTSLLTDCNLHSSNVQCGSRHRIRFLARYRRRWLNQAPSVLCLVPVLFWACFAYYFSRDTVFSYYVI